MAPTYPTPPDGYVATVEEVAVWLELDPASLTDPQQQRILAGLAAAASGVVLALGRPILPTRETKTGLYPLYGYDTASWLAWQGVWDDDFQVVTATMDVDESWTVVADVGLDGRTIEEIRRFVVIDCLETLQQDPNSSLGKRLVQSVSAEGQSVSYSDSKGSRQYANPVRTAGSKPRMEDLQRKWAREKLFGTVSRPAEAPWPDRGPYQDARRGGLWW